MKLHTTAAAALLVSTLALGGCGDPEDAKAESIGYGNDLAEVEQQGSSAPAPRTHDHQLVLDVRVDVPDSTDGHTSGWTSGHGTQDWVPAVE